MSLGIARALFDGSLYGVMVAGGLIALFIVIGLVVVEMRRMSGGAEWRIVRLGNGSFRYVSRIDRILNPWVGLALFAVGVTLYAVQHQYEPAFRFDALFLGGTLLCAASVSIMARTAIREARNPPRIPDEWMHCAECDYPVDPGQSCTVCPECGLSLQDAGSVRYGRKDVHAAHVWMWWGVTLFFFAGWMNSLFRLFD